VKYLSMFFGAAASALMLTAGTAVAQQSGSQQNGESGNITQQQQVDIDLNEAELKKFAKAFQEVQKIQEEAQDKMVNIIEDKGLTIEEYNKLSRHQQQGDQASEDISKQELNQFEAANSQINQIEEKIQSNMEEAITSQGLEIERFHKIRMGVMQDQELQQKLREIMEN